MPKRAHFTDVDRRRAIAHLATSDRPSVKELIRTLRMGTTRTYRLLELMEEEHLVKRHAESELGVKGRYVPTEAGLMLLPREALPPAEPITRQPLVLRLVGEDRDVASNAMERGGLTLRELVLLGARAVVEELRAREAAPPAPPSMLGALGL